jgi:UPF0716 family protein affecting phage T7 exclusion
VHNLLDEETHLRVESRRVAGRWALTWQAVNVMIGAAVFAVPGVVTTVLATGRR